MEVSPLIQPYSWDVLYNYDHLPLPGNYVHWTQTPEFHIYSANIPGARMEEIKVEVEDSRYLIIRTDSSDGGSTSFMRKFRLPGGIYVEEISAGYENGLLTVTVPRCHVKRGFYIEPSDVPDTSSLQHTAKAA